jgi:hypothetical protein
VSSLRGRTHQPRRGQKGWSGSFLVGRHARTRSTIEVMPMDNDHSREDGVCATPGTPVRPPSFASSLITELGLSRASPKERERGVAEWLRRNTPSESLRGSLIRCGYGHLLGH